MQFAAWRVPVHSSMADPKSFLLPERRYQFKVSPGVRGIQRCVAGALSRVSRPGTSVSA